VDYVLNELISSYTPELEFEVVIIISPDIAQGENYKVIVGSDTGEFIGS